MQRSCSKLQRSNKETERKNDAGNKQEATLIPISFQHTVESMNGHDREQLIDRPRVRRRLEDGEVAIVQVGHVALEVNELLGHETQKARHVLDLGAARPARRERERERERER